MEELYPRVGRKTIYGKKMKTISLAVTDDMDRYLKLLGEVKDISKSAVIRIAVDEYFKNVTKGGEHN